MKLLRYGPKGREKPGLLDQEGGIRDLSGILSDIDTVTLGSGEVAKLKSIDPESLPKVPRRPRIGAPIAAVGNFERPAATTDSIGDLHPAGGFPRVGAQSIDI